MPFPGESINAGVPIGGVDDNANDDNDADEDTFFNDVPDLFSHVDASIVPTELD